MMPNDPIYLPSVSDTIPLTPMTNLYARPYKQFWEETMRENKINYTRVSFLAAIMGGTIYAGKLYYQKSNIIAEFNKHNAGKETLNFFQYVVDRSSKYSTVAFFVFAIFMTAVINSGLAWIKYNHQNENRRPNKKYM